MDNLEMSLVPEYTEGQTDDGELPESPETDEVEGQDAVSNEEVEYEDTEDEVEEEEADTEEDTGVVPKSQYDNLRVDYTKKAMELADLKRKMQEPQEEYSQEPAYRPDISQSAPLAGGINNLIQNRIDEAVGYAMAPIEQMRAEQEEKERGLEIQAAVVSLSELYPDDFEHVAPRFIEMLEEDPSVLDAFELNKGVTLLFKAARSDYLERTAEAKAIHRKTAQDKAKTQKRVYTDSVPAVSPQQGDKSEADAIRDSIVGNFTGGSIFNI